MNQAVAMSTSSVLTASGTSESLLLGDLSEKTRVRVIIPVVTNNSTTNFTNPTNSTNEIFEAFPFPDIKKEDFPLITQNEVGPAKPTLKANTL